MRIDEYLDALCAALQVDPLRRDEIRLEAHLHLRERAEAYRRQGLDAAEAEQRTTAEFGDPGALAAQLSQTRPHHSVISITRHVERVGLWSIAYGFLYLLAIPILASLAQGGYLNVMPQWVLTFVLSMFLLLAGLQAFVGAALLQHRRWARAPMIVLSIVSLASFPGVILGLYALWTLLNPQSRQVCRA